MQPGPHPHLWSPQPASSRNCLAPAWPPLTAHRQPHLLPQGPRCLEKGGRSPTEASSSLNKTCLPTSLSSERAPAPPQQGRERTGCSCLGCSRPLLSGGCWAGVGIWKSWLQTQGSVHSGAREEGAAVGQLGVDRKSTRAARPSAEDTRALGPHQGFRGSEVRHASLRIEATETASHL